MSRHLLKKEDFESIFGESFSGRVGEKIDGYELAFEDLLLAERDATILKVLEVLAAPDIVRAGEHRIDQWDIGWGENLDALRKGEPEAMIPRYFGKYPIGRWKQQFVKPASPRYEYNMLASIQDWLFDRYLKDVSSVYEFGCGTGHNLVRAREANPHAVLYGLDWAASSQEIIALFSEGKRDKKMRGIKFDMFHPDRTVSLDPESGIYTIAALEQIGDGFMDFVSYCREQRPSICIHVEPIGELLDPKNLVDYLSLRYFEKRNYLKGYLHYLRSLENEGKITIHRAQRSYIGSLFIEGYSIIVWSPKI